MMQQRRLQRPQCATTRRGGVTARIEHRSGPGLGVPQSRTAATVQQTGVVYVGDQRDERVQTGEPLGAPCFAGRPQSR